MGHGLCMSAVFATASMNVLNVNLIVSLQPRLVGIICRSTLSLFSLTSDVLIQKSLTLERRAESFREKGEGQT